MNEAEYLIDERKGIQGFLTNYSQHQAYTIDIDIRNGKISREAGDKRLIALDQQFNKDRNRAAILGVK